VCVYIGASAASILLLPFVCRLADFKDLSLAAEHVLAAFSLIQGFA
jgi:hypothetical protein